jgi:hypothetical protein
LDNQDYFFKYFTKRESRVYLNYLFFFAYAQDHFVHSDKLYCLNRDRNYLNEEFKEIIINNVFKANKVISKQNFENISHLSNKSNNIINNLYNKKELKKLTKIIIPKYYLNLKPILYNINYLYAKDVPSDKIPHIIPNYFPNSVSIYSVIKNHIMKEKYGIYILNYKEFAFKGKKKEKSISSAFNRSKDYYMLNSFLSISSNNAPISSERNKTNSSNNQLNEHKVIHNIYRRLKNDIDIVEVERLTKKLMNNEIKKKSNINISINSSIDLDNKNDQEIFLSTLKKPFIGNRVITVPKNKLCLTNLNKGKEMTTISEIKWIKPEEEEKNKKIDITKAINEKMKFLTEKKEELRKKYPLEKYIENKKKYNDNLFNFYLNCDDEYDYMINKKLNRKKENKKNILNTYFPDRFLNAKKYQEYLINSPFLETLQKIDHYLNSSLKTKKNDNIIVKSLENTLQNQNIFDLKKESSFSANKKIYSFKETYKFMIGRNKSDNRKEFKRNIFNKTNVFYKQFKTLTYATKNRSNFKKSGAFAFSSFSGSNYDKTENEWKEIDKEIFNTYNNSFLDSNIMKKIKLDQRKKQLNLKNCTTFKDIARCPNIYI